MRGHQGNARRRERGRIARQATPAALLVVVMVVFAGCGGQDPTMGGNQDGEATNEQADETPDKQADEATTVTGALAGDPDLEGGCAWLETGERKAEILWPAGYRVTFEPLQLRGPDGEVVAEDGEEVTVRGEFAEDRVSVCQVGDLFEASAVVE